MAATFRYILLTAIRDRLLIGVAVALVLAALLGAFLGGATALESREMSLAYAGFATRLIVAVGLILFICFHIQRGFDNREIDLILSRPISRARFVMITWLAFSGIAVVLAFAAVIVLPIAGLPDGGGLVVWTASLVLEAMLVTALSLFFALTLRSAIAAALASIAFYLLARMTGFLLATVQTDGSGLHQQAAGAVSTGIVYLIGFVMPRLDLFGQTWWLNHGLPTDTPLVLIVLQAIVYAALLIAATVFDFQKRQF